MTLGEILKKYLDDNGYDGLCGDDCGCSKDDLCPCDSPLLSICEPAYLIKCDSKNCSEGYSQCFISSKENINKCPHKYEEEDEETK